MAKRGRILLHDDDIMLFQILPRLPARSLGRCKCVCKHWCSFLTSFVFTKMHLHHVNNQYHLKQLIFPTTSPCIYFRIIDYKTPAVGLSYDRSLPFKANCDKMSIIASLNGLVCVGIDSLQQPGSDRYEDIVLWNPLTGDYKTLPKDSSHDNSFTIPARGYGFYYSSCDDDYKLLRITQSTNAYIYSLKSDSWRQVESASCCLLKYLNTTCLLNENLYFLVQCRNNMNVLSYSIVRFDTNAEKFTEIATPSFDYVAISYYSLRVVSGRIHLWVGLKGVNCWDLWNMDEDGEWTKDGSRKKVDLNYHTMRIKKVCTSSNMEILRRGNFVESIVSLKR